mmetsp:Transcript_31412/g.81623  ORF Transcript_31412/g.81623 Transcript_31412/m.81623 type:complete len:778 (+) Transcript_31412:75-2408(+)
MGQCQTGDDAPCQPHCDEKHLQGLHVPPVCIRVLARNNQLIDQPEPKPGGEDHSDMPQAHLYAHLQVLEDQDEREEQVRNTVEPWRRGEVLEKLAPIFQDELQKFGEELDNWHMHVREATRQPDAVAAGISDFTPPFKLTWAEEARKLPVVIPGANLSVASRLPQRFVQAMVTRGIKRLAEGRVAVAMVAGEPCSDQGCIRDMGLLSGKSMLQIFCERVRRLTTLVNQYMAAPGRPGTGAAGCIIPVVLMVPRDNLEEVAQYARERENWGLGGELQLLAAEEMPVTDPTGRVLLASPTELFTAPAGSGSIFNVLIASDGFADLRSRQVSKVYMATMDNLLCKVADPLFLGYAETLQVDACVKTTVRHRREVPYGCLVSRLSEHHPAHGLVLDFPSLPLHVTDRPVPPAQGHGLLFRVSDAGQYVVSTSNIQKLAVLSGRKRQPRMEVVEAYDLATGEYGLQEGLRLTIPAGVAVEQGSLAALEVEHELAFAIKDTTPFSDEEAIFALGQEHQRWVRQGGGRFTDDAAAATEVSSACEISPLVSYDGEGLNALFPDEIDLPLFVGADGEAPDPNAPFGRKGTTVTASEVPITARSEPGLARSACTWKPAVRFEEDTASGIFEGAGGSECIDLEDTNVGEEAGQKVQAVSGYNEDAVMRYVSIRERQLAHDGSVTPRTRQRKLRVAFMKKADEQMEQTLPYIGVQSQALDPLSALDLVDPLHVKKDMTGKSSIDTKEGGRTSLDLSAAAQEQAEEDGVVGRGVGRKSEKARASKAAGTT